MKQRSRGLEMADLFGRDVKTIGKHINNAVREELSDQVVVAKFATNLHRKAQFFAVGAFLYIE